MKAIGYLCTALLAAALSSCTVKEDRGPCPCVLDIYLGNSADCAERVGISAWDLSGRLFLDRIDTDQYPGSYQKKVQKGFLSICAYGGVESMSLKGDRLIIPDGQQCDRVWAYCGEELDATGEYAEEHVTLHKQHAVIHVKLDSLTQNAGDIALRAVGASNGFDISTLKPSHGDFQCFTSLDADLHHTVCVPRQYDSSLELEIFLNGVLTRTVRLGELIENAGYSWEKEDLDDIYISLGLFTSRSAAVQVSGWDTEAISLKY